MGWTGAVEHAYVMCSQMVSIIVYPITVDVGSVLKYDTDGIKIARLGHVKSIWRQDWEGSWKLRRVPCCLIYGFGEVTARAREDQITLGARFCTITAHW
jgi:hypothetical protein